MTRTWYGRRLAPQPASARLVGVLNVSIALFALAGFLGGGAYTLAKNGSSKIAVGVLGVLAALAAVGGFLWL
jgi:hypothetical protein